MAPRIKTIVHLNLLWSDFAKMNEHGESRRSWSKRCSFVSAQSRQSRTMCKVYYHVENCGPIPALSTFQCPNSSTSTFILHIKTIGNWSGKYLKLKFRQYPAIHTNNS